MQKRETINIQNLSKSFGRLSMIFLLVATCPAMLFTSSTALGTEGSSGSGAETQAAGGIYSPRPISSSIAAGLYHSLFLKVNGTLWAMGANYVNQLGDGTTDIRNRPVQVADSVVQIAAGGSHSMFVKTDGTLWVMGSNYLGQLGDGTTSDYSTPGEVAKGVARIAADIGRY